MIHTFTFITTIALALVTLAAQQPAQPPGTPPQTAPAQQPTELVLTITGDAGAPPRFAVPPFIALSKDAETLDAAQTIAEVLWDDLNYEREFALIPRDVYRTIPPATALDDVPFDRWRELNADGLVIGTVQKTETGVRVEVRLFNVRSRQSVFAREYTGPIASRRAYAHYAADDIHREQRALKGVARTKLTFNSDRAGERVQGTIETRGAKEIYIADYDGENQRRVTIGFNLNINSAWSPDARSLAYTSYRRGQPHIFVSHIYQALPPLQLTKGNGQHWLPRWSPDGTRIAFSATTDGNEEIYVMNRDGANLRRLTNHPAADGAPTWSPSGTQIAFRSDRSGGPEIYVMSADGLGVQRVTREGYADRPTWSPAPFNEIAYSARTGPGNDIKVIDLATRCAQRPAHRLHVDAVGQVTDLHHCQRRQGSAAAHA
jgi:TolB protein